MPDFVRVLGIVIDVRLSQSKNAWASIWTSLRDNFTSESALHLANAPALIISTESGIAIFSRALHFAKDCFPSFVRESDSLTSVRCAQLPNAYSPIEVTESGIVMASIPGQFANRPLATTVVPFSMVTSFNPSQL